MELVKNSESVFRYKENGEVKERVDLLQFELREGEENRGSVIVYADQARIDVTVTGLGSIEESEAKAREIIAAVENVINGAEPGAEQE